jgi:hypothetical protein
MYTGFLHLHTVLRWVVLVSALVVIGRGLLKKDTTYSKMPMMIFVISLHVQFLIGLALYVKLSPITAAAFNDIKLSMKTPALRFYLVEHLALMLGAVVVGTIGSAKTRRATSDVLKHKNSLMFTAIALLLIVIGIPWPFRGDGVGRGLFPHAAVPPPAVTAG